LAKLAVLHSSSPKQFFSCQKEEKKRTISEKRDKAFILVIAFSYLLVNLLT